MFIVKLAIQPRFDKIRMCANASAVLCPLTSAASDSAAPRTAARRAPLSMGVSRQEHWSGLTCPPPGDLPDPGVKPTVFTSPALAGGFFTTGATGEAQKCLIIIQCSKEGAHVTKRVSIIPV